MRGIVQSYNASKKFGFLECIGAGKKSGKMIICYKSDFINTNHLEENDLVDFIIIKNRAINVFLIPREI